MLLIWLFKHFEDFFLIEHVSFIIFIILINSFQVLTNQFDEPIWYLIL